MAECEECGAEVAVTDPMGKVRSYCWECYKSAVRIGGKTDA